ncbi:hypothetical protein BDV93DRAFT_512510 [Ceratobasidium sp. AG-I]|nr:hypothetical protein BDV93DRAFT_512510 [Ceratobasidium sp. AG-I]
MAGSIDDALGEPIYDELCVAIEQITAGENPSNAMLVKIMHYSPQAPVIEALGHPQLTTGFLRIAWNYQVLPDSIAYALLEAAFKKDDDCEAMLGWTEILAPNEDAVALLNSYIHRISPEGSLYKPPKMEYTLSVMYFVMRAVNRDTFHLIPFMARATLQSAWDTLDIDEGKWMIKVNACGRVMYNPHSNLKDLEDAKKHALYSQSLKVMAECEVISLHARAIVSGRPPSASEILESDDEFVNVFKTITTMGVFMSQLLGQPFLHLFGSSFLDWAKALGQIDTQLGMCNVRGPTWVYRAENRATWLEFGQVMGFVELAGQIEARFQCIYPRCPAPKPLGGAWTSFTQNVGGNFTPYCGIRCQQT